MKRITFLAYGLMTGSALAHGGHEQARALGDAHWFASGDHILMLGLGGFALAASIYAGLRLCGLVKARS